MDLSPLFAALLALQSSLISHQIAHAADLSTTTIATYVALEAQRTGVDVDLALYVAGNESRFDDDAVGDLKPLKSGKIPYARGTWQITRLYHPEVSDECAYNLFCSTDLAMKWLADKKKCIKEFSTCRRYYARQNI